MRTRIRTGLPGVLWALACPLAGAASGTDHAWHFTVLLDGKPIGTHEFTVMQEADDSVIESVARFNVTVAWISVYAYDHRSHERWRKGCLQSLTAQTNDNGKRSSVQATVEGEALMTTGTHGQQTLNGCIRSFAYWDKQLLAAPRLLNAQTGEYQSVELSNLGTQSLSSGGRQIDATHYALKGEHLDINLWYTDSGEWIALESKLQNGRTLRYEIR